MKIQLDTINKIIRVEGTVSLLELSETLERLLPNGVWKTFALECGSTIIWAQPFPIYPTWPYYPWWTYPITYGTGTPYYNSPMVTTNGYSLTNEDGLEITYTLEQGTFNIEI
jgi:hypothetical protein